MLRDATPGLEKALNTSHAVGVKVDVWRSGDLLAEDVPILDGTLTETADQQVPTHVSLSVPFMGTDGRSWVPSGRGSASPIGADGHRLRISYLIPRADDTVLSCPIGWFRIASWELSGRTITVEADGLLMVLNDYKLLTPTSPPVGATLGTELTRLVEGQLPVNINASNDRTAPRTMAWTEDRLAAMYEIATAWPAQLRVDASGVLNLDDIPSTFVPDVILTEGEGGTVITAGDGASRDGVANIVVARGEDATDPNRTPLYSVARDDNPASATNVDDYDPVVKFFSSPLLTTQAQADKAARTVLARSTSAATEIPVECVPDPRITWGSFVQLNRADGSVVKTTVLSNSLPLTYQGGAQKLSLGVWAA